LVERSPEKAGVGGSTPSLATIFFFTEALACALLEERTSFAKPDFHSQPDLRQTTLAMQWSE
jgi:hypothetical protein